MGGSYGCWWCVEGERKWGKLLMEGEETGGREGRGERCYGWRRVEVGGKCDAMGRMVAAAFERV